MNPANFIQLALLINNITASQLPLILDFYVATDQISACCALIQLYSANETGLQ